MSRRSVGSRFEKRARDLAAKFVADCQALFEDPEMTEEIYDSEILQALVLAQGSAEDLEAVVS